MRSTVDATRPARYVQLFEYCTVGTYILFATRAGHDDVSALNSPQRDLEHHVKRNV